MSLVGRIAGVSLMSGCLFILGCNPPKPAEPKTGEHQHEHEHEHHFASYSEAVAGLDEEIGEVKDAAEAGDLAKADEPVHHVGHILDDLSKLAEKDGIAPDEIKGAKDELFDCFAKIDAKIHGGTGSTYDELADRIAAAMDTLRSKVKREEK
jgi:hypothetical protein